MVRGIEVHYYAVCPRKLWLFHKGIGFEQEHDRVLEGALLHEEAYQRLDKELSIDELAVVDAVDDEFVREVKLTSKMEKADQLQMLYYLYLLKQRGIEKKGLLSYPTEKKTEQIILDTSAEKRLLTALGEINDIIAGKVPSYRKLPYCSKCAYRDFCEAGEEA